MQPPSTLPLQGANNVASFYCRSSRLQFSDTGYTTQPIAIMSLPAPESELDNETENQQVTKAASRPTAPIPTYSTSLSGSQLHLDVPQLLNPSHSAA